MALSAHWGAALLLPAAIAVVSCSGSSQEDEYVALPGSSFAGLKAGMACSAIFVAGRLLEDVLADELGGLPAAAAQAADPVVDRTSQSVAVAHAPGAPPRLAVHRRGRGCTVLPPLAGLEQARTLPNPEIERAVAVAGTDSWSSEIVDPGGDALAAVIEAAFDGRTYGEATKTIGVVVVHHGKLVAERYRPGFGPRTPYRVWSAAKMLTNALVGILVGRGALDLDAPAPIPEWARGRDPRAGITVAQLLHMSSGLEQRGAGAYPVYYDGADAIEVTTSAVLEEPPGSRWSYANRDTLLLVRAMRAALGDHGYWRFPIHELLDRIGMYDTVLETDPFGNYILSSQVFSTPRDLARLGLLFLNDGVWEGERVLPDGWVAFSTRPAPARRRGLRGVLTYGLPGFVGYGAQLWLYEPIPGVLSHQAYSGIGHRGQYVTVVPARDLVVVRTGLDAEEGGVLWRQDRFFSDVIEALQDLAEQPPEMAAFGSLAGLAFATATESQESERRTPAVQPGIEQSEQVRPRTAAPLDVRRGTLAPRDRDHAEMPIRGPLAHIDLSISDPDLAIPFYEALLGALGYQRLAISAPDFRGPRPRRAAWQVRSGASASFGIEVRPSAGPNRERPNDRYAPGMHHVAFHAESARDVDRIHQAMLSAGATVLDAPADYTGQRGYSAGYYAAFYADPDGIKIEVAHIPESNP